MAYTKTVKPTATFTTEPKYLNYGRHHYGTEFGKTTRVRYGDHVLFGVSFIDYKFKNTNFTT